MVDLSVCPRKLECTSKLWDRTPWKAKLTWSLFILATGREEKIKTRWWLLKGTHIFRSDFNSVPRLPLQISLRRRLRIFSRVSKNLTLQMQAFGIFKITSQNSSIYSFIKVCCGCFFACLMIHALRQSDIKVLPRSNFYTWTERGEVLLGLDNGEIFSPWSGLS